MSYSVNQKCWNCKKQDKCMDGNIVQAAVAIIHGLGQNKGHLGGGAITHNCTYGYEPRNEGQKFDAFPFEPAAPK